MSDSHAAEVQAALDREFACMLMHAAFNQPDLFNQFRHGASALIAVRDGRWAWSAKRPYNPPPMLEAAWPALPIGMENMAMTEVQQWLRSQGVQVTPNDVANLQLDAVQQLKDAQDIGLVLNEEQALPMGDGRHGAGDGVTFHGGAL